MKIPGKTQSVIKNSTSPEMLKLSILSLVFVVCTLTKCEPVASLSFKLGYQSGSSKINVSTSSSFHPLTRAPDLGRRQGGQGSVICAYYNGNSSSPITMSIYSTCTTEYTVVIWGSCIYSSDIPVCSLYGACVDQSGCSETCSPNADVNDNVMTNTLSW